ncbi:MAG: hypothetical protein ABR563_17545 [Pyrinomonadaceae bacterium]
MNDEARNDATPAWYQQGDVTIKPVARIPEGASPLGSRVLAEGEATGHKHLAEAEDVRLFMHEGTLYMRVPSGTRVVHEEHRGIAIPPGDYLVGKVREYDHFAERSLPAHDDLTDQSLPVRPVYD